jgi:putative two-component system response regulator
MQDLMSSHIYIVDDEPHNLLLLSKMLTRQGYSNISTCSDPLVVKSELESRPPDLLLLDLTMPQLPGLELLEQLQPLLKGTPPVPVLVLSGDNRTDSRRAALSLGARDFVSKPFDPPEVLSRIHNLLEARNLQLRLLNQTVELERLVSERTAQLVFNQMDSVRRLGLAAEYRDDQTGTHIINVSRLAAELARAAGQDEDFVSRISHAAQLHDIGKLAIPDSILLKPGPLTADEWVVMKQHVDIGAQILQGSDCPIIRMAEEIARCHHERWDGTGYQRGLSGLDIPLSARIVSICDVFDALTSVRPYKAAWTAEQALEEIRLRAGTQFDAQLVDHFVNVVVGVDSGALQAA